jgi:serine/threonine-protein kinase mTOR
MQPRFDAVCEIVLRYRDHKDAVVRRAVMALLPRLAAYDRAAFARTALEPSLAFLLAQLRKEKERAPGPYAPCALV